MQELIAQVEELGIEINHTTSLVIIFGIIFLTAIIVHFILHNWCCAHSRNARRPVAIYGCKLLPRINYFTVWPLPCRDNRQRSGGTVAAKGSEAAEILTTCAKLWVMVYALLSFFSLLDVIFNLSQRWRPPRSCR